MSRDEDEPVTERLCLARMETLRKEIQALKLAVWTAASTVTLVIVIFEFLLRFLT